MFTSTLSQGAKSFPTGGKVGDGVGNVVLGGSSVTIWLSLSPPPPPTDEAITATSAPAITTTIPALINFLCSFHGGSCCWLCAESTVCPSSV